MDIYFLTYTGSLESNLLQMVIAKEKINLFMKGQDTDLDLIYDKFGIDYNLLALLLHRGVDEEGNFQIRWETSKLRELSGLWLSICPKYQGRTAALHRLSFHY